MFRRVEGLDDPDTLPTSAKECRTIGEYIDFVLRMTQGEIAEAGSAWMKKAGIPGAMHQTQISDLVSGKLPRSGKLWTRYMVALKLENQDRQFFRLVRNAAKLASARAAAEKALQTAAHVTEPLFAWVEGVDGVVVKLGESVEKVLEASAS